ncbi:alanine--tRNA ligase [bacterium]|nr:alanine--tRNA ligase [bacterium]
MAMPDLSLNDVRGRYLAFFAARDHAEIPSASLVPENDPTTLFTGSGMQPLLPYLLGQPHSAGTRLVDSQKSFRSEDIEEAGDNRHTTFFEMLGNWSLGDYFKKEQLPWIFEFLTDELKLNPENLYVTVFAGDEEANIPRDEESAEIWQALFAAKGMEAKTVELITEQRASEVGMQDGRIFFYDSGSNWWSRSGPPAGMPAGEPGGPDSEMFYDFGTEHDTAYGEHCHPNCDCGRFMEVGNNVFMEYLKQEDGSFAALPNKNVDFGGGLERIAAAVNNSPDVFAVDELQSVIAVIAAATQKTYSENDTETKSFRIIADHMRAATFLLSDGVRPSPADQGYVARRLIRRAALHARNLGLDLNALAPDIVRTLGDSYAAAYPAVGEQAEVISTELVAEAEKFYGTLERGIKKIGEYLQNRPDVNGQQAFELYATYGLPIDVTIEVAAEEGKSVDVEDFNRLMEEHRDKSRAAAAGKFAGGLADHSDMSVKYHTATHLLHQALRTVLGDHVLQKGSNITPKRLRFDFSHPDKMTDEQKKAVEDLVNKQITANIPVTREETTVAEAKAQGALGLFEDKYADSVHVYKVGDFSIEICGGPHVDSTGTLGTFRITKEESTSAGVRRIKAVLTGNE